MTMPVLFIAHGSPMLAVDDDAYASFLTALGASLAPRRILVFSAHWVRRGQGVTGVMRHRLIYDFSGFPEALYRVTYPAPGDASLLDELRERYGDTLHVHPDRGLDHGVWVLLRRMFPAADIPVAELSVDASLTPEQQFQQGRLIGDLARDGTLIIGSGGSVHNLMDVDWRHPDARSPWAVAFDDWLHKTLLANDLPELFRYRDVAPEADRAVPRDGTEHFAPLFYALGAADSAGLTAAEREMQEYQMGSLSLAVWAFREPT